MSDTNQDCPTCREPLPGSRCRPCRAKRLDIGRVQSEGSWTLGVQDVDRERFLLGTIRHKQGQETLVYSLLEPEDFYGEEHRRLFEWMKRALEGSEEARKLANGSLRVLALKPTEATETEIREACWLLRRLRRQRRIDQAAEEMFVSKDRDDWLEVVSREVAAVKAIGETGGK